VFKNRVPRRISAPKKEEVAGGWRRLHNEELHNLCASPNIIRVIKLRMMRWVGHVAHGIGEKCIQNFGRKTRREETTRRPRNRSEDNVRKVVKEMWWEAVDWMHLA
jgi:hypothetical protein